MKHSVRHSSKGFTLVELLVVIAIIAVLATAGFAAANAAIQRARKASALASATAIESAVNSFFNDYGYMPMDGDSDRVVKTDTDITFLDALLGNDKNINPRGLKLLSVKDGKGKKDGLIYSVGGNTVKGLYDPWGGPYNVILDLDLDEKLDVKPKGQSRQVTLNGRRVAVWSDGADGVNSIGKFNDDVKTWGQ